MHSRAVRLAYDGRAFRGFQRQPDVPTVEGALFDALDRLLSASVDHATPPPGYAAAGRTDAGVSALAQTVSLRVPEWLDAGALNAELPSSVRAWAVADAPEGFHARHDARRRSYVYHLHAPAGGNGGPLVAGPGGPHAGPPVDERRVRRVLDALAGRHDFHNLTLDDEGTVREVAVDVERDGAFLRLRFSAGGFPRQFVRRAVALAVAVGTGERALDAVEDVLDDEPLPGPDGIAPAPPEPLVLDDVRYPGAVFEGSGEVPSGAVRPFEGRRVDSLTRARVAEQIVGGMRADESGQGETRDDDREES